MNKYTRTPHYSCEQGSCAEEVSYPASELKEHKSQLWCENCWDYDNPMNFSDAGPTLDWSDLDPFIPDHIVDANKKVYTEEQVKAIALAFFDAFPKHESLHMPSIYDAWFEKYGHSKANE